MMNMHGQNRTGEKRCSPDDGPIIMRSDLHRVRIGNRTATIHASSSARSTPEFRVFLDFASDTKTGHNASAEVTAIIARLFPEEIK
jgi:hypothetical protein